MSESANRHAMSDDRTPCGLLDDKRTITAIVAENAWWQVGDEGVSRIVCYGEPGEYCYRPAFAVYYGDDQEPRRRINWSAGVLEVRYATEAETTP